ncbi:porin [Marinobacterium weihaiense]|uniref:Porin n=1 Tax=Marinobacterium weihaiense TaxID=2851016 RepID=A0ABS6MDA1_9GAMM|nr:porin [Marinobacterium weihaiense]MBV0934268.1 porin [Marinobacterium weihaiense]
MTTTTSTAVLASALTLAISGAVQAAPAIEAPMPDFTLFASLGALDIDDRDFDPEAFELEFGVNGLIKADAFKMRYQFVADVSDAVNNRDTGGTEGEDDIHVKEAKLIFPTHYGVFVLAPRSSSGVQRDMYANINLFEYNETHHGRITPTGNPIFNQADEGQDVLAYATPRWNNLRMVFSTLSLSEDNSEDLDVKTARLIYDNTALNLGISRVLTEKTVVGAGDDYARTALTAGYDVGQLHLGATYEINEDTFNNNDFDSYGVAARYQFQAGLSAALGYYDKDADNDDADNTGVVVQLKKQVHPNVSLWAETGQYDNSADNIALGVNLTF